MIYLEHNTSWVCDFNTQSAFQAVTLSNPASYLFVKIQEIIPKLTSTQWHSATPAVVDLKCFCRRVVIQKIKATRSSETGVSTNKDKTALCPRRQWSAVRTSNLRLNYFSLDKHKSQYVFIIACFSSLLSTFSFSIFISSYYCFFSPSYVSFSYLFSFPAPSYRLPSPCCF